MSSRTATRSHNASSPPRNQEAARRNLRSHSVDLGVASNLKGPKRGSRQASVASATSSASKASKGKGTAKANAKGKGAQKAAIGLSAVQEDIESSESDADEPNTNEFDSDGLSDDSEPDPSIEAGGRVQPKPQEQISNAKAYKKLFAVKPSASEPVEQAASTFSRSEQRGPSRVTKISSSNNNEEDARPTGSSTSEILEAWQQDRKDNNKENTKPVQQSQPANRKRQREPTEDEDSDGFQSDDREPDPARKQRPAAVTQSSASRPAKRARVASGSNSSAIVLHRAQIEVEESEEEIDAPVSTLVKTMARKNVELAAMANHNSQSRTPWSDNDEALLIQYIEEHGCSWAFIAKLPGWDLVRRNFQVQLKDKARNIKVSYLKANLQIPVNFGQVRLGKKELDIVRKVNPDYDQDQEEM